MRRRRLGQSVDRARLTAIVVALGALGRDVIVNRIGEDPGIVTWIIVAVAIAAVVVLTLLDPDRDPPEDRGKTVPDQAPGVVADLPGTARFVGREQEVAEVLAALDPAPVVLVAGRRGIGTSSCAVEAANRVGHRYPDGQMYFDLRPRGRPVRVRRLVRAMAARVGVDPPARWRRDGVATAASRVRQALEGRQLLLVLDNVTDPSQVAPLLPLPGDNRVVVAGGTGMSGGPEMAGLAHRAALVRVAEPEPEEAVAMCAAASSAAAVVTDPADELVADPLTVELVRHCGLQPRAVGMLGVEIARQGWDLATLAVEFRRVVAAPAHQDAPCAEPLVLVASHDVAYAALSRSARRLYRLLSLVDEPLGHDAIAALRGPSLRRLRGPLQELVDGAFVVAHGPRDQVRPVLASYARLHLRLDEPVRRRSRALTRLLRHLAHRAMRSADRLQRSAGARPSPQLAPEGSPSAWFQQHDRLLWDLVVPQPARPGAPGTGVPLPGEPAPWRMRRWWLRLAMAQAVWLDHADRSDDWARLCQAALATPTGRDRARVAGWARNELGVIERRRGELRAARRHLMLALAQGGYRGRAQRHTNLGLVFLDEDQVDSAIEHLRLARQHRRRADRVGAATTDLALGTAYLRRAHDRHDEDERAAALAEALTTLRRAAEAFHRAGVPAREAAALNVLGQALWESRAERDGEECLAQAVDLYRGVDETAGLAAALLGHGAALLELRPSRAEDAEDRLQESERLRPDDRPSFGRGRTLLYRGDALAARGRDIEARWCWQRARDVAVAVDDHDGAAAAGSRLDGSAARSGG